MLKKVSKVLTVRGVLTPPAVQHTVVTVVYTDAELAALKQPYAWSPGQFRYVTVDGVARTFTYTVTSVQEYILDLTNIRPMLSTSLYGISTPWPGPSTVSSGDWANWDSCRNALTTAVLAVAPRNVSTLTCTPALTSTNYPPHIDFNYGNITYNGFGGWVNGSAYYLSTPVTRTRMKHTFTETRWDVPEKFYIDTGTTR